MKVNYNPINFGLVLFTLSGISSKALASEAKHRSACHPIENTERALDQFATEQVIGENAWNFKSSLPTTIHFSDEENALVPKP